MVLYVIFLSLNATNIILEMKNNQLKYPNKIHVTKEELNKLRALPKSHKSAEAEKTLTAKGKSV